MPSLRVLDVINGGLNTLSRLKWGTTHHLWSCVIITLPFQHVKSPDSRVYCKFSDIKQLLKLLLSVEPKTCHFLGPFYQVVFILL